VQIVVPMSGFGERFRRAGYTTPKPLIQVEGKPIIAHVVDLFDPLSKFIFVVNQEHLEDKSLRLLDILRGIAPASDVVAIAPHRLGPVHACLSAIDLLEPDGEVFVNYADFSCVWNFQDFITDARKRKLHGSVPAYRGFHPHSGGSTNYAYIQEDSLRLQAIREKQPFTNQKTEEYASTGGYYFQSASLMIDYFKRLVLEDHSVNGEFYVSSAFDLMAKDLLDVGVYEISHFMQWGTPEDLDEYKYWSDTFRELSEWRESPISVASTGPTLVLASGRGERFASSGYKVPKPALSISGKKLLDQVCRAAEINKPISFSLTENHLAWFKDMNQSRLVKFSSATAGQAVSTRRLLDLSGIPEKDFFTVLPSDTLFADKSNQLNALIEEITGKPFVIPWVSTPTPFALKTPKNFGWLVETNNQILSYIKDIPPHSNAKVLTGAFTFSSPEHFRILYEELFSRKIMVNGEYYLDSFVELAQAKGFAVRLFQPTLSVSLGTPYEFETFRYWQGAFEQWASHPYSLELDPFITDIDVEKVRKELKTTKHQPGEWHGDFE
jgi:NDP-sugar pyrophosphorylase family protein